MGVWALEFNPGLTGNVYEMVEFNGDLFAFCDGGTGGGVWRRTPPNWTRTFNFGGGGRACVWDGQMWAGRNTDPHLIYRSDTGLGGSWVADHDFTCGGPYSYWSALGGYGNHLYAYQYTMCGITTAWYRRNTAGTWVQYPPDTGSAWGHGDDIVPYGGRVYFSYSTHTRYYDGGWSTDSDLDGNSGVHFTVRSGILYAAGGDGKAWRRLASSWSQELHLGGAWGATGAISVGDDGNLWLACEDGANSRVYVRSGGRWVMHSAAGGVRFKSATAHDGGAYAGTQSCEFWRYDPSYDLTPTGGGLYPQALDVDADGAFIYVAAYDVATGQPVLVRADLPLVVANMGLGVFNPGAGDAINVKCTGVGGRLAVSGNFGAGDAVETSEDAGGVWANVGEAAWGAETAQPLLVDADSVDQVTVCLQGALDLVETFDQGTLWLVRNAALPYSPGAAARLEDGDELLLGDDAANMISYSPCRGVTLRDITGAFVGNVSSLEVI